MRIGMLAVRTDHQRRGVGRQLMADLLEKSAARGIENVFVTADNADVHALDFYRALGAAASPVTLFAFAPRGK